MDSFKVRNNLLSHVRDNGFQKGFATSNNNQDPKKDEIISNLENQNTSNQDIDSTPKEAKNKNRK